MSKRFIEILQWIGFGIAILLIVFMIIVILTNLLK